MINRVVLVGRMVRDPEIKHSQSGVAICRFSIAVNRTFKNAQGEQEADFPNIVTFRKTAENVANFLNKGSLVGIDGRIQTGSYTDQQGKKIFTTEIVADSVQFLEPKSNSSRSSNSSNNAQQAPQPTKTHGQTNAQSNYQTRQGGQAGRQYGYDVPPDVTDDDLPF